MISVGSRDGRKGLSFRYGVEGEDMDLETELEEGEACFQINNGDDSTIDPDVALSYLDEKLQDVLGHFQKDFEGGVSAENLGAKFGGYGSFLPTYQRSPACPHPKTPPKVPTNNASISPNRLLLEGGRQNSVSVSNTSQPTRHGPASTSGAPRAPPINDKLKQELHTSYAKDGDKFTSNGQQQPVNTFFANVSDPKSLKVRLKVGSDNLLTRKNAEIYSGLGLDVSPSSSLETSPVDSDDFCHVPRDESPTSILEMMTSFPVLGGLLLSPLPYDLLSLSEKEKHEDSSCGSVHKRSQESTFKFNKDLKADQDVFSEKKPKTEDNFTSRKPISFNNLLKKESDIDNLSCEKLVSNALKLPLLSDNILDFRKGTPKEESLDPMSTHDDFRVKKPYKKEGLFGNTNFITFPIKSESDVSKNAKILDTVKPRKLKAAQKATSHEKDGTKMVTSSSSGSKKKPKGSQSLENGFSSVDVSKINLKNDFSKNKNNNNGKVRETYKDFFGELDPELEDGDDVALAEKPKVLESDVLSKERLNEKKGSNPSSLVGLGPNPGPPTTGNGALVSDAASATLAAVVNEDWVCCDKCEKWRLLPPGVNPGSLPEKWLCSMLDWLPGMNRCSISQEETTKAITTHFLGPAAPTVHPGAPGVTSVDPLHPGQRHHQPFGPQVSVTKKHGIKDVLNEPKHERPSLSSNSTKKNGQISNKTRSLNGANRSPLINEVEFQDSGQSSSLIGEKNGLKHKEKKKLRDNLVDEGNNALQLKIRNKRETSQDCSRNPKKVKTDDNHGTDKDRVSDHDRAVFKEINSSITDIPSKTDYQKYDDCSKDSKPASKIPSINPKNQNRKCEERDIVKKRKSNEFDDTQIEETSETGQRKGKKVKVSESREEEKGKLLEPSRRNVALHASLAATSSSSKVSGSRKPKTNNQEAKGSPVESVSSRRNIKDVDTCQDPISPKKDCRLNKFKKELDIVESLEKAEIIPSLEFEKFGAKSSFQNHNGERRKNGKGSSSRSKDKNRNSKSDIDKINLKNVDVPRYEENSKGRRNRSQDKPPVNFDKFEKGSALKKESSGKPLSIQERDVSGRGKSHSLPPSGKSQPFVGSQKELAGNSLLGDENQLVNVRNKGTPSPLRRESSSQAASAIKEAKALKHMADRLKNSGSNHESNSLYFQAALKFLYGSSLLESSYTESAKHGDIIQSMGMYSSTAKLCEYVAHEFEKSKEMAAAALAYKLAEVAYLKVVYSSHTSALKDRQELQMTLTGPTGESPSSSASDIDNLNNQTAVDKSALAKGVSDPQIGGNHVISARNKPNFLRILNFAQDVNLAMEASRRSQIAFAASNSQPEHAHHKEIIKPALDFNFQDIDGFVQLVRVAMEVISR